MRRTIILLILLLCGPGAFASTTTHYVNTASTSNLTAYTSGSFTPTASDLLVVYVVATGTIENGSITDTQNLGWDRIDTALKASSADTVYLFVAQNFAAASSMTVTFNCTQDAATGAIIEVDGLSGMSRVGAAAVRQTAKQANHAGGSAPAPVFASSVLTGNPTIGAVGNAANPATLTPPTSWTEQADVGYATPTTGGEFVSRDSGFTGTTVTWGSSSASAYASLIAEFDTSGAGAAPSLPTLVQTKQGSRTSNNAVTDYLIDLPNNTISGNCIIVGLTAQSGATITVSDDQSNTYTAGNTTTDTINSQLTAVYYALNVAANTRLITIHFSLARQDVGAVVSEFYNVASASAIDGNNGNFNSGVAMNAGNITPTVANDLIYQFAIGDSGTITSFTQGTGNWNLLSQFPSDRITAQYYIQPFITDVSPMEGQNNAANSWVTSAIALKAAAQGSQATGMRIVHEQHNSIGNGSASQTPGFPCSGNLLVVAAIMGGTDGHINSISDSNSNTYTQVGSTLVGPGQGQMYYAKNPTCSTAMTQTFTLSAVASQSTIVMYDIAGADTSAPLDTSNTATGTNSTTNSTTGVSITPTNSNGIIFSMMDVQNNTVIGVTGTGNIFDSVNTTPNIVVSPVDENNGWAHVINNSTSAVTFVWTSDNHLGDWANFAGAFQAPAGGGGAAIIVNKRSKLEKVDQ